MISRRELAKILGLSAAGAAAAGRAVALSPSPKPIVKPRKLQPGDTVGLVLPASMAFEGSKIDLAREQLEAIGFEVRLGGHARSRHGYFAGTDHQRAADVNAMFADDGVDGIFCYTGGWGTPRVLPLLDFDLIRRHPKVIIGYSDITALVNAIHQETGLVTFHGPVAASHIRPWTLEQLRRVVMSTLPIGTLTNPEKGEDELVNREFRILTIRGGRSRGKIVGGNLTLLAALMGTPWEVRTEGAILMLEDIREEYYRVDRMLTQLAQGGKFDRVAGVVFGYCTKCSVEAPSFSFEEILRDRLEPLGVPAMAGLAFGHLPKMLTLPIGLEATLDADAGTLTIEEAAVV